MTPRIVYVIVHRRAASGGAECHGNAGSSPVFEVPFKAWRPCRLCDLTVRARELEAAEPAPEGEASRELLEAAQAAPHGATVHCPSCGRRDFVKRAGTGVLACAYCRRERWKRTDAYRAATAPPEGSVYEPRRDGMQTLNRRNRFAQK